VELLLHWGADIGLLDRQGKTAEELATAAGNHEVK
jgi:hypothetical protein